MAIRYNQFALAIAPPGTTGAVVDDPVSKTASFTAKPGVRYFIHSGFLPFTMTLPSSPTDGMMVGVANSARGSAGVLTVTAPGSAVSTGGASGSPSLTLGMYQANYLFRYWSVVSAWVEVGEGLASYQDSVNTFPAIFTRAVGFNGLPDTLLLSSADGIPGRVESSAIQELRPWSVLHNLLKENVGVNRVVDSASSGAVVLWQGNATLTNWLRCLNVRWHGPGAFVNLVVRGMAVSAASADFSPMKLISNFALGRGNLILKGNDPLAAVGTRIITPSRDYYANYTDYILSWGEHVWVRYMEGNWNVLAPIRDGGATVDHRLDTTDAVANLIHDYPTEDNDRVIAYKVRVEALHAASGDSALFDIAALFYRNGAGTIVQKNVTFINGPFKDAGAVAWAVTFTIATTHIEMLVTGDAGDTIRWRVTGSITENL